MISMIVAKNSRGQIWLMIGSWESLGDMEFDTGSGEYGIEFMAYKEDNPQAKVFSVIAEDWSDHSLARELEKLLQFAFDLGRQVERKIR